MLVLLAQSESFRSSPQPIIVMMLVGFAIGAFGYLAGSRFIVAIGVVIVFVSGMLAPML
jgi:hypothetical protein